MPMMEYIKVGAFTLENIFMRCFQKRDRVRSIAEGDGDGEYWNSFIGYRAKVSTLKRRMELMGFDRASLERDFLSSLQRWQESVQDELNNLNRTLHSSDDSYYTVRKVWLEKVQTVIGNNNLADWLSRLAQAAGWPERVADYSNTLYHWNETGDPLLSLMTSTVEADHPWLWWSDYNFPCSSRDYFFCAVLLVCDEEQYCELNLNEHISEGEYEDFTDLEELNAGQTLPFRHARQSLSDVVALVSGGAENPVQMRMCYSGLITVMEAYLSDIFIRAVKQEGVKRRFVESYGPYREGKKFSLGEIFTQLDLLERKIEDDLKSLTFHNIEKIAHLYEKILLINFPKALKDDISSAVIVRHDIVHRNGKKHDGTEHNITGAEVIRLKTTLMELLTYVDGQILDALEQAFQNDEEFTTG
nr:HEPN/Toprim-associated domain-containing protein [uncultured Enterobacter sp.]